MNENWLTYHGDPKLKEKIVTLATEHVQNYQLKQGILHAVDGSLLYGDGIGDLRACYEHSFGLPGLRDAHLTELLGWPLWLILLQDMLFECLPKDDIAWWHVEFARAVPVGVDLKDMPRHLVTSILEQIGYNPGDKLWEMFAGDDDVQTLIFTIVRDKQDESIFKSAAEIVLEELRASWRTANE